MSSNLPSESDTEFLAAFAGGKVFERVFSEGMALVDETASYLDGPGRAVSKELAREARLTYTSWSMELTTRLMQAASWLVMQRAVRDGDMRRDEAFADKYRLTREGPALDASAQAGSGLPARFLELVENAEALFERITRLDEALYSGIPQPSENAISNQINALQRAADKGVFDPLAIWSRAK
ncbi:MAG: DUF1465 family protein [Hyphomonadaceae bacterium]